jgi:hypothetical protein
MPENSEIRKNKKPASSAAKSESRREMNTVYRRTKDEYFNSWNAVEGCGRLDNRTGAKFTLACDTDYDLIMIIYIA